VYQTDAITVTIKQDQNELAGLGGVLLSALGVTGVIVIGAMVVGGVFAAVLFWFRSRGE
jgi:hypothetical protein